MQAQQQISKRARMMDRAFVRGIVNYLTANPKMILVDVAKNMHIGRSTITRIIGGHGAYGWLKNEQEWKNMHKVRNGRTVVAHSMKYVADENGIVLTEKDGEAVPALPSQGRVIMPGRDALRSPRTGDGGPQDGMHWPQPARVSEATIDALVASGGGSELSAENAASFGQYLGSYTPEQLVGHHTPVTDEQANRAAQVAQDAQRTLVPSSAEHAFKWNTDGKQGAIFRGVIFTKFADGDVRITNTTPGKVTTEIANVAGLLTSLYPDWTMSQVIEAAVDWHDIDAVIAAANNPGHALQGEAIKLVDIAIGGPAARDEAMQDEEETTVSDDNNASGHYTDFPGQAVTHAADALHTIPYKPLEHVDDLGNMYGGYVDAAHAVYDGPVDRTIPMADEAGNTVWVKPGPREFAAFEGHMNAEPDPEARHYQEYQAGNHKPASDPRMIEIATAMIEVIGMEALGIRPLYQEPDDELRQIEHELQALGNLLIEVTDRVQRWRERHEANN